MRAEKWEPETVSAVNHRHMWGHPASSWEYQHHNNALEAAPCGEKHAVRVCFFSSHQVDDEDRHENSQENLISGNDSDSGSGPDIIKNCAHLLPLKPRIPTHHDVVFY